ncbi:type II secretion system F family protein [Streptomyces triculaminicus]|uniref:Type II secretion system F family protein n=2 Tax=Streptomyces TaxID=1883 RepID=A0A939FKV8_9ACTN|nr:MULTISPECIES: type II secretion system F family protein [Streptomyces]MBO0652579.1 type II secretion system F family protein [Streptomyces triculaminicus]QSY51826.1 type II secretion system F family protein [Streptomyces griseocarneus]
MSSEVVHSLWAVVLAVAATSAVTVLGKGARDRRSIRRRGALLLDMRARAGSMRSAGPAGSAGGAPGSPAAANPWRRRARQALARGGRPLAVIGGVGLVLVGLVGGITWCVAGLVAAYGIRWWRRRADSARGEVSVEEVERQLPLAADLLAACLAAGAGPREAAEAVGGSLGGPVGERLAQAAAEVRLGGEPGVAWGRLGSLPGAGGTARCLERAQATGVPAVEPMSRLAAQLRAAQARAAGIRARRAGVLATAPLGLCFLPAFLTVGVVPVVIGLAGGLMRSR